MRMRAGIRRHHVEAHIAEPYVISSPIDRRGSRSLFERNSVRIERTDGKLASYRDNPRSFFPKGRRRIFWDRLDAAFFSSYALWNYLTFPALLFRDDIEWSQPAEQTLEARFDPAVPTHSAVQQFHFDADTGLLRQHDYTAEVFGDWARAANVVLEHAEWEGVPYPSVRRVTPRAADGSPRPWPALVFIEISDWRLL
jgi:hypothetical protein